MTGHEFFFSTQRRHRISRHLVFWIVWWLAYTLLFHIPVLEFKGWGFSKLAAPATFRDIEQIGPIFYFIKLLIFSSFLGVVLPQAIFTYFILYWFLPNYFYRKKNPFVTAAILAFGLVVYHLLATQFLWFTGLGNYVFGLPYKMPLLFSIRTAGRFNALRQQLGSLPVLLGIALMITLIKRWWLKRQEIELVAKEKTKAELQLLKAQVHPHFLFNTLNNIYFFTLTGSPKAAEMINKLSGLLHYILTECDQPFVSLEKEMKMIQDYVSLEKIRYGNNMEMSVELPDNCPNKLIAPLLLIPFIENSFKHGASMMLTHAHIELRITMDNSSLHFFVKNSRPGSQDSIVAKAPLPAGHGKIGLKNVKKRLQLLYPLDHELNIFEEAWSFSVYLRLRLIDTTATSENNEVIKQEQEYALG